MGRRGFHVENVQGGACILYQNRNHIRFAVEGEPFATNISMNMQGEEGKQRDRGEGGMKDARLFTISAFAVALKDLGIMFALFSVVLPLCLCRSLIE